MLKSVNEQSVDIKKEQSANPTVVDNNRLYNIIKQIEALEEEILHLQIKGILYGTDGGNRTHDQLLSILLCITAAYHLIVVGWTIS
jgi:hypothetical protein